MKTSVMILFDVDGTLLLTGGATRRCIRRAAERVLGPKFRWTEITAGELDPQIFRGLAERCGIRGVAEKQAAYTVAYLAELEAELKRCKADVMVLPGIRALLDALLRRENVTMGLLTGNFQRAVELKLQAADIDPTRFTVGAFAEDGQQRSDLVHTAIRRFQERYRRTVSAQEVILVGDTPRDIACARAAGCRILAVATGQYSVTDLAGADRVVADLSDPTALYSMIDGTQSTCSSSSLTPNSLISPS